MTPTWFKNEEHGNANPFGTAGKEKRRRVMLIRDGAVHVLTAPDDTGQ
ncbi:MAG: hypothetical protein K9K79_02975 [Desulfohalobiaceae bacterium]|nr:hypothetical protein [Desulfohalobiaceae bacterium]